MGNEALNKFASCFMVLPSLASYFSVLKRQYFPNIFPTFSLKRGMNLYRRQGVISKTTWLLIAPLWEPYIQQTSNELSGRYSIPGRIDIFSLQLYLDDLLHEEHKIWFSSDRNGRSIRAFMALLWGKWQPGYPHRLKRQVRMPRDITWMFSNE
jgi:hypothetical protein